MIKIVAKQLRKNLTDAEKVLWRRLRSKQINHCKFRRRSLIGRYIVDFVCFEKKLIIELDGGQHSEQIVYDQNRSQWLESQGFRVLRFWNHDVLKNTNTILEEIEKTLTPHLSPPPSAEGRIRPLGGQGGRK